MNAGFAGINYIGIYSDHISYIDWSVKPNSTDIYCYTIGLCPAASTGVSGLVDPFHDGTSMDVASEVDVRGFTDELKRYTIHLL